MSVSPKSNTLFRQFSFIESFWFYCVTIFPHVLSASPAQALVFSAGLFDVIFIRKFIINSNYQLVENFKNLHQFKYSKRPNELYCALSEVLLNCIKF